MSNGWYKTRDDNWSSWRMSPTLEQFHCGVELPLEQRLWHAMKFLDLIIMEVRANEQDTGMGAG